MRIVNRAEEMASALQLCQQETQKSFGDARIFVERFISKPRHIANRVLTHPVFIRGELSTDFIPTYLLGTEGLENKPPVEVLHAMALATTLIYHLRENLVQNSLLPLQSRVGVSSLHQGPYEYVTKSDQDIFPIRLENIGSGGLQWQILVDTVDYQITTPPLEFYHRRLKLNINGEEELRTAMMDRGLHPPSISSEIEGGCERHHSPANPHNL